MQHYPYLHRIKNNKQRIKYDHPTLVFSVTNSAYIICSTFNPNNSELSKWAYFMPLKT